LDDTGWKGAKVRNAQGRTGVVFDAYAGFLHVGLHLAIDGGGRAYVQLNSDGRDSGESGWQWFCENFDGGAAWLPLGDHSGCGVEFAAAPATGETGPA
jgi:hypothetical protein